MNKDLNAVHCIGNGKVVAYLQKADIFQIFGNDYSVPSFCSVKLNGKQELVAEREEGTCIFSYKTGESAILRDFVSGNFFMRQILCDDELSFDITFNPSANCSCYILPGHNDIIFAEMKSGSAVFGAALLTPRPYYLLIKINNGKIVQNGKTFNAAIKKGGLVFSFSPSYNECFSQLKDVNIETELSKSRVFWRQFSERRLKINPSKEFDATACQIKAQLSCEGAEIAGYPYHLAYVRDNFGTYLGLFKLGMAKEAQKLLDYFNIIFKRYGRIQNAQGFGLEAFHVHENDGVEITGYLGLMPFYLADYLKNAKVLVRYKKLIKWCVDMQASNLRRGMLPFNGDETYIAGAILPRSVLADGSLEATMLFHTLLKKIVEQKTFDESYLKKCRRYIEDIEQNFELNFVRSDELVCNNTEYEELGNEILFRYGVRDCGHDMGLCYKNKAGRYVCEKCFDTFLEPAAKKHYKLAAVSLTQIFIEGTLIPEHYMRKNIEEIKEAYKKKCLGNKFVGYEFAFILMALKDDLSIAGSLKQTILLLMDEWGMWSEYYADNCHSGARCRPWESAINIDALSRSISGK